ncbi:MAG: RsmB/NOP family class I SAM-dependent RNA methyltransferase [Gammaproteobacteria bacterium]|jgi:16S rRNA C967 or C1407 C5-methylase (RsmB/RsmF family)|nr:RsmB/NOP family class I SAM-dependent RNA methyltransferase [Gammaproteobacteria bacterium]
MARKKDGKALFEMFYSAQYGPHWPQLYESLKQKRKNYISLVADFNKVYEGIPGIDPFEQVQGYHLDPASIYPVLALGLVGDHQILDACAAPGGKSLMILRAMSEQSQLLACDVSSSRLIRLRQNLAQYSFRTGYTIEQHQLLERHYSEQFDRILLDAPCSSERHWVEKEILGDWRPGRSKYLSHEQHALLCRAWDALLPGGRLVYSTCSISMLENDGVIERFLKKRAAQIIDLDLKGQKTKYGRLLLPHLCEGLGPIYYAVLMKEKN